MTEWEYIVTDPSGAIHGRFDNEEAAVVRREELGAEGVESWVEQVTDLELEEDPC